MASKLVNIGHAVRRLFGSNFTENEVEEIGAEGNSLWTTIKTSSGNEVEVNADGQLHTVLRGKNDENNSTTDNLGAGSTFTGTPTDTLDYASVTILAHSDQDSASGGLVVQYSADGATDWHDSESYTLLAGSDKFWTPTLQNKYFRVKYTNGGTPTTDFHISTILRKSIIKSSSHNITDPIKDEDDAELVKAVITGKQDNGVYDNAGLTNNKNLRVSINEYGDTPAIDAFSRLRISEPFTIFDSKQLHDKQPLFWDESLGGSATSVHSTADADVVMSVTASASDFAIRQTKQRFNYQPAKSQLVFFTFYAPQATGATKRAGLFDGTGTNNLTPNNGVFFKCDGDLSWNIAKNGTVTESVTQENWNVDKLDGTGVSQITLDMSATQIGIIDWEWLGVGRVRVGFVIGGLIYYVHYFNHSNDSTFDSVYMSTPNLPLRYDIQTDGTTATSFSHICSSVISEGGLEKTGVLRSVDNGTSYITGLSASTAYALIGIKLKTLYKDITVIPEAVSAMAGTTDDFKWSLEINPTISGTFTFVDLTDSAVQVAYGTSKPTVTSPGIVVASGYASRISRQTSEALNTALKIGSDIAGNQDELVLVIEPVTSNASILTSLSFRELL